VMFGKSCLSCKQVLETVPALQDEFLASWKEAKAPNVKNAKAAICIVLGLAAWYGAVNRKSKLWSKERGGFNLYMTNARLC
jgi:hypothetical protein